MTGDRIIKPTIKAKWINGLLQTHPTVLDMFGRMKSQYSTCLLIHLRLEICITNQSCPQRIRTVSLGFLGQSIRHMAVVSMVQTSIWEAQHLTIAKVQDVNIQTQVVFSLVCLYVGKLCQNILKKQVFRGKSIRIKTTSVMIHWYFGRSTRLQRKRRGHSLSMVLLIPV